MSRAPIILAGRSGLAHHCLDRLAINHQADLIVVPSPERVTGSSKFTLEQHAKELGVRTEPSLEGLNVSTSATLFSILYHKRIGSPFLDYATCVNLHLSPLPRYRGCNPIYWAIRNGETNHGVTLHKMNLEFDEGDIIAQKTFPIYEEDTAGILHDRAVESAIMLFDENVDRILARDFVAQPQQPLPDSYYRRDAINFKDPVELGGDLRSIYNELRANVFPPLAGPYVVVDGQKQEVRGFSLDDGSNVIEQNQPGTRMHILQRDNKRLVLELVRISP